MERSGKRKRKRGGASSSTNRVERKTVEKIRRNKMKSLYSILNSLVLSNNNSHDGTKDNEKSLPDQIDKATDYIKYLEASVDEAKKKKESLLTAGKRLINPTMDHCSSIISSSNLETFISPELDIQVQGSFMDVTLISGNQFIVSDVMRVIHEERAMVLNANFSVLGCSVYLLIHAEIGEGAEAEVITERLKKLVNGSSSEDSGQFDQLQEHLWDFDIGPNTWEFKASPNIWEFDMYHALHSA